MGQHRAAYHVTNGPDSRSIGTTGFIHMDKATLVHIHTTVTGQQAFGKRTATHGHDQFVEDFLLLAFRVLEGNRYLLTFHFGTGNTGTQTNAHALLGEQLLCFFSDSLVNQMQELVLSFEYHYFRTQSAPYAAQFQADNTGTNHTQT